VTGGFTLAGEAAVGRMVGGVLAHFSCSHRRPEDLSGKEILPSPDPCCPMAHYDEL